MSVLRMAGGSSQPASFRGDGEALSGHPGQARPVDLGHYARVLRQRWVFPVLGMLLGVGAGLGYLTAVPQHVQATAVVNLNVISSEPFNDARPESQLIDPQTEVQLVRSSAVLAGAAQDLGTGESVPELRQHVTVEPVASATVVRISFSDTSERRAMLGADAVATRYLAYRSDAAAAKVKNVVDKLTAQQEVFEAALAAANKKLAAAKPGSPAAVQAASDRQLADIQLTSLVGRIDQLGGVNTSGGSLISKAGDNPVVVGPAAMRVLPVALLLGLVVGIIAGFVVHRLDRRIRDAAGVIEAGGGPVLAELRSRVAQIPAGDADLDALCRLRERLLAGIPAGSTIVVLDLTGGPEATDVGTNLAVALAEVGPARLLLPGSSTAFTDKVRSNLCCLGRGPEPDVYSAGAAPQLEVVLHDDSPAASSAGRSRGRAPGKGDGPMTVLALPPNSTRAACLAAGRRAQAIVLVVSRLRTRSATITELVDDLGEVGAEVQGSILVHRRRSLAVRSTLPLAVLAAPPQDQVDRAVKG